MMCECVCPPGRPKPSRGGSAHFSHLKVGTHWSYFCNPTKMTNLVCICWFFKIVALMHLICFFMVWCFSSFLLLVREGPYAACEFYKILRQKCLGNAILCGAVPVAPHPGTTLLCFLCPSLALSHLSSPLMHGWTAQASQLASPSP